MDRATFEVWREVLFATMREHKVDEIVVSFSGGGDSGQIDDIDAFSVHKTEDGWGRRLPMAMPGDTFNFYCSDNGEVQLRTLTQAAEDIAYAALEFCQLDWYNNDGGQGEITINATKVHEPAEDGQQHTVGEIDVQVGINYMSTEDYAFTY